MTEFCLSTFLGVATIASLESDNASGHGNQRAEALLVEREQSRIQSQLFMCRKPRRTADDNESIDSTPKCTPSPKSAPSVRNLASLRSFSPTSVADMRFSPSLCAPKSNTLFSAPSSSGSQINALRPVRRSSFKILQQEPITVVNAGMAATAAVRGNSKLGRTSMAGLADLLSTLEL